LQITIICAIIENMNVAPTLSFSAEFSLDTPEHLPIDEFDLFIEQNPQLIEGIKKANAYHLGDAIMLGPHTRNTPYPVLSRGSGQSMQTIKGAYINATGYNSYSAPGYDAPTGRPPLRIDTVDGNKPLVEVVIPTVLADSPESGYIDRRHSPSRPLPIVSLMFSMRKEDVDSQLLSQGLRTPARPDYLSFEGTFMGYREKIQRTQLRDVDGLAELGLAIPSDTYQGIVDFANEPPAKHDAIEALMALGTEQHLDPQLIEALSKVIIDYATYHKPEPVTSSERFGETGRCLVTPMDFKKFCKAWAGIDIATGEYSEYSIHGDPYFYHGVNVLGDIIIDWTARQFSEHDDKPYPFIYTNGDESVHGHMLDAIR
jgi:hypothetical protein